MNEVTTQMSDEDLDNALGTSQRQFTKFRTLSVDNGVDTAGTGATGDFVEKQYDPATQQTTRIAFADMFPGIILASKAQVADKAKYPSWRTGEFDPSNVEELIDVFPLQNGKFIKNENGVTKKTQMTYRDLKAAKSTPQPDGGSISTYNYFIVLYVGVDGEVIKLKFKGSSRGNYFDYSKAIAKIGAKIYNVVTLFSTYKDTTTGKYAIKFDVDKEPEGNPTSVDPDNVREMRIQVAKSMAPFQGKSLPSGQAYKPAQAPTSAVDTSPIKDSEIVGNSTEEEIDLGEMEVEDVPYPSEQ